MNRYTQILSFAKITEEEGDRLWKFMGAINNNQREIIINKQKELLRTCPKNRDLSTSENGTVYLLISINFFSEKRFSNSDYFILTNEAKAELNDFRNAGLINVKHKTQKTRFSIDIINTKGNASKTKTSKPFSIYNNNNTQTVKTPKEIVKTNLFQIYGYYAQGYTWENIAEALRINYNTTITVKTLRKHYARFAVNFPPPKKPTKSNIKANRNTHNAALQTLIDNLLTENLDRIYNLRKNGQSWRNISNILSNEFEIKISHNKVFIFFKIHAHKYPKLPLRASQIGRPKKKSQVTS
jgi:hypothetical protein